jgi:hypothetical protein
MNSFAVATAFILAASAPAFAGSIDLTTLATNGAASTGSGSLVLTPNNTQNAAGAGYLNTALALGTGANFSESFTFKISSPTAGQTANGFAFFLSTNPAGTGASSTALGLTAADTLAVEFYDYGNKNLNPPVTGSSTLYNSNLVAAIQSGNTTVNGNPPASYGSPGPQSCVGTEKAGNGCMNNGDVWTADITYIAGKLTVSLSDAGAAFVTVISNYVIALGGGTNYYAGFTGSTGSATDSVAIETWSQSVPEPMTLGMFGAGLAALGLVRRRRSV